MDEFLELDGKRALVTGGTGEIGGAVVSRLREASGDSITRAEYVIDGGVPTI